MNRETGLGSNARWRPLGLSLVSHLILIVLAVLLLKAYPRPTPGGNVRRASLVLSVQQASDQTEYLDQDELPSSSQQPPLSSNQADAAAVNESMTKPPPVVLPEPKNIDLAGTAPLNASFDASKAADAAESSSGKHQYVLTDADLKLIQAEQNYFRNLPAPGPTASISVFGSGQLDGRRFVFVIDRSRSMGSGGLGVIDRAQKELVAAIAQLQDNHWFQVVAYNQRTTTIDRREMLRATEDNKKLLPEFMNNLIAFGATNHENGLVAALSFQPDVIVLLTDCGYPALDGGQLRAIRSLSRRRTSIHTVQFGFGPLQENDNFMMRMAKQNSGSYRYINVNDWQKN